MNMTLEERERRAYADGDVVLAETLQTTIDHVVEIQCDEAYDEGYDAGKADAQSRCNCE